MTDELKIKNILCLILAESAILASLLSFLFPSSIFESRNGPKYQKIRNIFFQKELDIKELSLNSD